MAWSFPMYIMLHKRIYAPSRRTKKSHVCSFQSYAKMIKCTIVVIS